jgi:serine/threonine protein kinase
MKECFKLHCVICEHQISIELEEDEDYQLHYCPSHLDRAMVPLSSKGHKDYLLGLTLSGKYVLVDILGKGQFAKVYYGIQMGVKGVVKPVAIKVLSEDKEGLSNLFLDEAKIISRLKSENIVKYIDSGIDEAHHLSYIVMSLIEGETLSKFLKREGNVKFSQAIDLSKQILTALEEAHQLGIIHRDLKPSNIMLEYQDGKHLLKLLDFGVARPNASRQREETQGMIPGTPAYMAPELFKQYDGSVSAELDTFSVGIILYQLLTNQLPYQCEEGTDSIIAYYRLYHKKPKPISLPQDIPQPLAQLLYKAIHLDPKKRFQSVTAFKNALVQCEREIEKLDQKSQISGEIAKSGFYEESGLFLSKTRLGWLLIAASLGAIIGIGAHFFKNDLNQYFKKIDTVQHSTTHTKISK